MTPQILTPEDWQAQPGDFIALWTDADYAYSLFAPGILRAIALIDGAYPALSPTHSGAAWFERLAHDLNGHNAAGATDTRPAIQQFRDVSGRAAWPDFHTDPSAGVHALTMGPVPPGIAEPAQFHLSVCGETVLKLQTRLGYTHTGTLALIRGKSPRLAARFAARICGDATSAHSLAFAHAAEAALEIAPPPRAVYLRAVIAELERIASHAGSLGDIVQLAALPLRAARFYLIQEAIAAAAATAFGHRLMMDCIIPGGIAGDLRTGGAAAISAALATIERELPELCKPFAATALAQDRLAGIGIIAPQLTAPGPTGRAAGGGSDSRLTPGYPPYETLDLQIPTETAGDTAARAAILAAELAESIRLIHRLLHNLPEGNIAIAPPAGTGTAVGVAESNRGPVWVWLRIADGAITGAFIADPSARLFQLLQHAAATSTLAEFPLVLASLNPSPGGTDL
jgi:Ni,Fe-hydrogenase III large subunit